MQVIGILGGVASGKSVVAGFFQELGAGVLDADRAGHEVLEIAAVKDAIGKRWGDVVFGPEGSIDRAELAKIVFQPPPKGARDLAFLEQITHPRIGESLQQQSVEFAEQGVPAIVLDAPVMLKAAMDQMCNAIVFVDAPPEVRSQRAQQRGWTKEEFAAREKAQQSLDIKRERADCVIDNSGSLESTKSQVIQFWKQLFPE